MAREEEEYAGKIRADITLNGVVCLRDRQSAKNNHGDNVLVEIVSMEHVKDDCSIRVKDGNGEEMDIPISEDLRDLIAEYPAFAVGGILEVIELSEDGTTIVQCVPYEIVPLNEQERDAIAVIATGRLGGCRTSS